MSTTISQSIRLSVTKDGDTLGGCILLKGILDQQRNRDTGAYVPDYATPSDRAELFPRVTSSLRGGPIVGIANYTNVKWYFNNGEILSGSAHFERSTEGAAGSEVPSLIIKGNPVSVEGGYELRFEADVNNGSSVSHIVLTTRFTLSIVSAAAYSVILRTANGGVVDTSYPETLTPFLRLGTNEVASGIFYKYYKMIGGEWTAYGSNASSRNHISVGVGDVSGVDLFKVDVHLGGSGGEIICSDTQEVIDDSDPYKITAVTERFYFGSPQQTITPKVHKGTVDVTVTQGWGINDIRLVFSDGTVKKSSTTGSISLTFDEVGLDTGVPYLYITATKN